MAGDARHLVLGRGLAGQNESGKAQGSLGGVVAVLAAGDGRSMEPSRSGEEGKKKSTASGKVWEDVPSWRPGEYGSV